MTHRQHYADIHGRAGMEDEGPGLLASRWFWAAGAVSLAGWTSLAWWLLA
jgi:hypothetical protein